MGFNNGFEHVRLENKWKKLRIQYREAGMSEEAIQEMSSMALAEQIFTIDKSRILKYLGHLAPEDMQRLDYALKNSLALNPLGSIRCVFAIPVTESSASRPTAPGRRDIPSTFWMRSLIKLSARFSPR